MSTSPCISALCTGSHNFAPFTSTRKAAVRSLPNSRQRTVSVKAIEGDGKWCKTLEGLSKAALVAGAIAASCSLLPNSAIAVSGGGGLGTSLSGKDFGGQDLHNQKFYKADMRASNFKKANLKGANLFGAFAKDANFAGADLSNADVESVDFEGADLTGAILSGAQATNARFKDTKLTDTDWTDAILRRDVQKQLCKIARGTNPVTQVDTLESLMC